MKFYNKIVGVDSCHLLLYFSPAIYSVHISQLSRLIPVPQKCSLFFE